MAATFSKNKSKIEAVLEHNLAVVAPKLHSVNLISDEDRDGALNPSVDSKTRTAVLINTIERKIVDYRNWWILVYVLLSSGLDAERAFFESITVLPERVSYDLVIASSSSDPESGPSTASTSGSSSPLFMLDFSPSEQIMVTQSVATSVPKSAERVLSQEDNAGHHVQEKKFSLESSVWYTLARDFPGIKFSNYYTKQVVTSMGNIIKGEGIELQIPGRAIKKGHSIEFMIQGCIEGPFELPDNISLATPVFLIKPHYKFQKAVTLLVDAFISLQSCKELVFLTSPVKPRVDKGRAHWDFIINETVPQITDDDSRIMVEVEQFCLLCFGIRRGPRYQYRVSLHAPRNSDDNAECRAIFSVSLHHKVFLKNLEVCLDSFQHKFYDTCETVPNLPHEKIELILPTQRDAIKQGYKIQADRSPCQILRNAVDLPRLSRKHKENAIADGKSYPPRIMLTVTYTNSLLHSPDCELRIKGIDEIKTLNMKIPTVEVKPHPMNLTKYTGYSSDKVTMPKLLCLTVSSTEFIDIPEVIGARSDQLADILEIRYRPPRDHEASARGSGGWKFYNFISGMFYYKSDHDSAVPANEEQICCEILQKWITLFDQFQDLHNEHDVNKSSLLANALHHVGVTNSDLLQCLESYSGPLTMNIIHHFPVTTDTTVNIPREVGVKYFEFGTHLLQDATGAFIRSLEVELNRNSERINQHILEHWLKGEGRPISWDTLVEVLNIIRMGELAKKIEDKYITAPT